MYDAQFETIVSQIDRIESILATIYDSAPAGRPQVADLEAELAALEHRLDLLELRASYEPDAEHAST